MFKLFNWFKKKTVVEDDSVDSDSELLREKIDRIAKEYEPLKEEYTVDHIDTLPIEFYAKFPNSRIENDFPRVFGEIASLYQKSRPECIEYISSLLIIQEGEEHRQGFPLDVLEELMFLNDAVLKETYSTRTELTHEETDFRCQ
jgi:hypothetical protein